MNIPHDRKYTATHEWLMEQNGVAVVGITEHAQTELGDIVYTELPAIGRPLVAGKPAAAVESVKAASDIYAPVAGEVVEVNPALAANPALVNRSPYDEGWLFKMKITDPAGVGALLDSVAYRETLKK